MRVKRLIRWTALVALGLVTLVVGLALLLPRTDWAAGRARQELVTRVTDALDAELQVDGLSGSLLSNLELRGVRIVRDGQVVIAVDRAVVRYDAWQLWRSGLNFDAVELSGLNVSMVEGADGWNIARLVRPRPPDAPPPTPVDFTIDDLQVTGASVAIAPQDGVSRDIAALEMAGALDFTGGRLTLEIDRGAMRDPATGVAVRQLQTTMTLDDGRLGFEGLTLSTAASEVTGNVGFVTSAMLASLDLDVETAPLALADLTPYVPALERLPQSALITADLTATAGNVSADWTVRSDAGGATGTWSGRLDGPAIPLVGRAETRALNLAEWVDVPDLESAVDAVVTFDGQVPLDAPDNLDVTFTVAAPQLALLGHQASGVKASGRYRAGSLTATGSAAAYGATATATIAWRESDGGFSLEGRFADADLSRLPARLQVPPLASSLAGTATLGYDADGWHGEATLDDSTLAGASIAAGAVASFDLRADPLRYAFAGDVSGLDPASLGALGDPLAAELARYPGAINGRLAIDAQGTTLATLEGTASVDLVDTTLAGIGVDTATIKAGLLAGALDATVDVGVRELTDRVLGTDDRVPFRTSGTVQGTVRLHDVNAPVTIDAVDADLRISLGSSEVRGTAFDSVELVGRLVGGVVTVTRLDARGQGLEATASGTVVLSGTRESNLDFTIGLADLGLLEPYVEEPIEGGLTVDGRLTGPPDQARMVGSYAAIDVRGMGVSAVEARGDFDLVVPDFDPTRATGRVTTDASLIETRGVTVTTATVGVGIEGGTYAVEAEFADESGSLGIDAVVRLEDERIVASISALRLTAEGMTWERAPGPPAEVVYGAERLQVTGLTLAREDARVYLDGEFGDPAAASPLTARLERVRLEDFAGFLPPEQQLTGPLGGTVTAGGAWDDPRVSADIEVGAGTINDLEFESFAGTVSLEGTRLVTDVVLEAGRLGRFEVTGSMPSPLADTAEATGAYDLVMRSSDISLGFLQPLTTAVSDIAGTGRFDVTVTGPADDPSLDGTVTLSGGAFTLAASGVSYRNVEANLQVRGQQVVVERLELADDDGHRATVQGELNLPGIGPPTGFELYVNATELHVLENEYGEVVTSANLTVMGDLQTPLISGTIRVDRGVIEASDLLDRLSARGYRRAPIAEGEDMTSGPIDRSSLSVTLDLPDNVVIRGRDLRSGNGPLGLGDINATIGGALSIRKETAERPLVTGNVRVVRGTYQFQGRRFEIQRDSEIIFNGSPTNPSLNVDATRAISGVVANVHLGGTLERPDLVLTSDPPLDQGDVLSLIVFNQAMNSLQTEQRVSLAARAGVLAAGALASPLSDSVRRALDLDTFEIRPDESASGASVIIGRQLNDRVFVGFRQTFGATEASQLSFEYRVSELLRIVTSLEQGAEGRSLGSRRTEAAGIDLIFVIR